MQIPSNLFLNKLGKPALYLPTAMAIWGTVSGTFMSISTCHVLTYDSLHWCCAFIWRARRRPFHTWFRRSSILCWVFILPLKLVYALGAGIQDRPVVLGLLVVRRIFWTHRCWYNEWPGWRPRVTGMALVVYHRRVRIHGYHLPSSWCKH